MKYRSLVIEWVGMALVTTACTVPVAPIELPGLDVLRGALRPMEAIASDPLRDLADQAEADAPELDVVQIEYNKDDNVIAFVILNMPEQSEQSDQEYAAMQFGVFRRAVEALWKAALAYTPEVNSMGVAFMQVRTLTTLDRGPAPVGWLMGGVIISLPDAAKYLQGPRTSESFESLLASEPVTVIPLDELYTGMPNHPVRSLEAQS